MNIFLREMKANRKSLIFWSIGMLFMVGSGMAKYSAFEGTGQSINEMMADMPKSLQAIMGVGSFDLSSPVGYYGLLYLYLVIMATIHASMLGANILAKEERDKTVEFLLIKPVSRKQVLTAKLLASTLNLVILNLVTFVSSIVLVQKSAENQSVAGDISILMIGMFILQLLFLVVGTAIASLYKNSKKANSLATGILLLLFFISVAIDMNEKLEGLKYVTPFKYFDAKNILHDGSLNALNVSLIAILILLLSYITFRSYRKRDMNI